MTLAEVLAEFEAAGYAHRVEAGHVEVSFSGDWWRCERRPDGTWALYRPVTERQEVIARSVSHLRWLITKRSG